MRKRNQIRWAIVAASVLAALWYLWPTVRLYSMSPAERAALQAEDPAGWDSLKDRSIELGLDLQGGMHLALELDESAQAFTDEERIDAINRALEIIRNRVDQFGVAEPLIQKVGDERIIVELPGIQDEDRAKELVQQTAFLEFQLVLDQDRATDEIRAIDATLAGRTIAEPVPADTAAADTAAADAAADTTATLPADSAVADTVQTLGELLGGDDESARTPAGTAGERSFSSLLQVDPTGQADFVVAEEDVPRVRALLADSAAADALDDELEWLWGSGTETYADGRNYRALWLVETEPLMTGEGIATAAAGFDPMMASQPIVTLQMTAEGASHFADITGQHVNERLAIVLDEVVRMAPNIRQRIPDGNAQIEGFDSIEEARDIGIVLRAGALPAPLEIIEERTIGPSLGADSVAAGRMSGILGLIGVAVCMVIYYRVSGLVAVFAVFLNLVMVLAALAAFGATLTLPGIAGLILTVGMAVDANVLVFERVREELALGKSVRAGIDAGYDRAFVTIMDAQITTLIAAVVLFQYGTGPIKGFAIVLSIGILTSIFTAVFVTRTIFDTWTQHMTAKRLSI